MSVNVTPWHKGKLYSLFFTSLQQATLYFNFIQTCTQKFIRGIENILTSTKAGNFLLFLSSNTVLIKINYHFRTIQQAYYNTLV